MLKEFDIELYEAIEKEKNRQVTHLELIASENYVSDHVLTVTGSILTNKYAEGYPGRRYYGGCENVDEIEDLARARLKNYMGVLCLSNLTQVRKLIWRLIVHFLKMEIR